MGDGRGDYRSFGPDPIKAFRRLSSVCLDDTGWFMKAKHNEKEKKSSEGKTAPAGEAKGLDAEELDPEELKEQLEEAKRAAEERRDLLLRCRAELDNTIKRAAREKEALSSHASERLILKILPVVDSLDQAAKQVEGMERIRKQFLDVLKTEGLSPIEAKGEKFDPYKHEALMMVESDEYEEGTVTEEVLRGYAMNGKVIRFSKVLVSKKR